MPLRFKAKYTHQLLADLAKLDAPVRQRIWSAIEAKLLSDPMQHGRKLANKKGPGQWRFRVGDYRIRFDVEGSALTFYRVRHRKEIYR